MYHIYNTSYTYIPKMLPYGDVMWNCCSLLSVYNNQKFIYFCEPITISCLIQQEQQQGKKNSTLNNDVRDKNDILQFVLLITWWRCFVW
jgi:hypothetical protein